jgi:hypothetical protein
MQTFLENLWAVTLDAAPWLALGLLVAGLMKAWLPTALLQRWLGGAGVWPSVKAAVIGTPLPLCSCSVVPAALALRRGGASRSSTVSFLVATPENGADSLALTYALLGPFMTVVRPVSAICSAVLAGMLTVLWGDRDGGGAMAQSPSPAAAPTCCGGSKPEPAKSCCSAEPAPEPAAANPGGCCAGGGEAAPPRDSFAQKTVGGVRYAFGKLFQDIAGWMALGLVLAAVMNTLFPPAYLAQWGSGIIPMLLMALIGVPMYICATASTPVAAALMAAGMSPGTVLVFLLAGPATNLGTVGIIRREMGMRTVMTYLAGVVVGAIGFGLLTDWIVRAWGLQTQIAEHVHAHGTWIPTWLAIACAVGLIALAVVPRLVRLVKPRQPEAAPAAQA